MEPWLVLAGTIFTAVSSVLAVIITNNRANREITAKIETVNAVQEEKITELTREVRRHNNFAERIPAVEGSIKLLEDRIKNVNRRLDNIEKNDKGGLTRV
jgi:predicted  nucleic acid-binding Zn-ribbon protein